ncbi:MAG: DUF6198 family protein [Candidatus Izemoplasmatales bacterium]
MKTKISLLFVAILCNGLGSAITYQTKLGMSAYGASAANISNYLPGVTPGIAFILISAVMYIAAVLIHKKITWIDFLGSLLFLLLFSSVLDLFIMIIPQMEFWPLVLRVLMNIIGLLILLLGIAVHLKVNIAVHPMDVFLKVMQEDVFKSVVKGTYFSYGLAFIIAIIFGLLNGQITDIGFGTLFILTLGGVIMSFYNRFVLKNINIGASLDTQKNLNQVEQPTIQE